MVHIEEMVPSAPLALVVKLSDLYDLIYDMEVLEERRQNAKNKLLSYLNKLVKPT